MWSYVATFVFLILFRGRIARVAREKGHSPTLYLLILLMFPMLAAVAGALAGRALVDILNPGDVLLLLILGYGLAISSFVIAIWLTFRLAGRGPSPLKTTTSKQNCSPGDHTSPISQPL